MAADGVDFVDEDDAGGVLLALFEEVADAACADADEHLDEVRTGDREEGNIGFAGYRAGEQGLAGSRRSDEQDALGNAAAELLELLRLAQEFDDLFQLFLGFVDAGNVFKRHLLLLHREQAGAALAEGHGLVAAALHLAEHEEPERADDDDRRELDQDIQPAIARVGLDGHRDLTLAEGGVQLRVVRRRDGVELALVSLHVPVDFVFHDGDVADLARLGVLQELRVGNLSVFPHAARLLEDLPQEDQAGKDKYPEDDCLDR